MRLLFTILLLISGFHGLAQDGETEEVLVPRMLALDKNIPAAQKFNEEIARLAFGYVLAFVDEEQKPTIRYVYKTEKNQTLRLDFRYAVEASRSDTSSRPVRKPVIVTQKISAEIQVIADIYNYLFNSNITPDRIMTVATTGRIIAYHGRRYQFILQSDDYEPGYWVMTFIR
jgi:hypothetical protein